ncbi:hypothetical protein LCGC14_1667530 [marine sediment metagenome]|uniref:Uncharacterized protein n=1 Tax=marine sediment metagenome TaxID=412755 RepID=A0A0F9HSZ8_9ZZZZ
MSISKEDLLVMRKNLSTQLGNAQKNLYNIEGAIMFINIELKKMEEQDVRESTGTD